jgi:hypothetical protein
LRKGLGLTMCESRLLCLGVFESESAVLADFVC